jgi:hypothetical protein
LRTFGTAGWQKGLREYLSRVESLTSRYAREREMRLVPVHVAAGKTIELTPGGQSELVKKIIDEFCPRFTPGGKLVYVGDTGQKWAYFDSHLLETLCIKVDEHGKMPDVVVYDAHRDWLVLVEAVTSHGPVNAKRHFELKELLKGCKAGLVFVTAFLSRKDMVKYLNEIAWETEVWVAESPSHLIHFNGERFLGPYPG